MRSNNSFIKAIKEFRYTAYAEVMFFLALVVSTFVFSFISYESVLPSVAWGALIPFSVLISIVFFFKGFWGFRKSRVELAFFICGSIFSVFILLTKNFSAIDLVLLLFLFTGALRLRTYINWVYVANCFCLFFLAWVIIATHLNLTDWGWLPGQTTRNLHDGLWYRISLLPYKNPAFSALLSLVFFSINVFNHKIKKTNLEWFVVIVSLYFLAFSGNRTGYLIFLNLLFILVLRYCGFGNLLTSMMLLFVFGFTLFFGVLGSLMANLASSDLSFLVRSHEVEEGSVRGFMILEHLKLFMSNPLAGVGEAKYHYDGPGGTEIQLFKSLALYGIFGVIYYIPFVVMLFSKKVIHKAFSLIFLYTSAFYSSYNQYYSVLIFLLCVLLFNENSYIKSRRLLFKR